MFAPPLYISEAVEHAKQPGKERHRWDEKHQRRKVQPFARRRRVARTLDRGLTHGALRETLTRRNKHDANRDNHQQHCARYSHPLHLQAPMCELPLVFNLLHRFSRSQIVQSEAVRKKNSK
jgi:hypothetical protein